MNLYGAIDIDIVASRKIEKREIIQEKINKFVQFMNEAKKDILLTPITFTLGDEWQIVLKEPKKSYEIICDFQKFLRKESIFIYCGFGIGTISTNIYEDTRFMDGECFIKAREALNIVKNKNRFYNKNINSKKNNVYFNAQLMELKYMYNLQDLNEVAVTKIEGTASIPTINDIINLLIENNEVIKYKITDKQLDIIELYEKYGSYSSIINDKNLSKADISQKINNSNYFVIKNNNLNIEELLNLYCSIKEGMRNGNTNS
ncbi:MAG: SatD family protein [Clostridium sp.]|nr:SatD family protein [Clostridium sp.]